MEAKRIDLFKFRGKDSSLFTGNVRVLVSDAKQPIINSSSVIIDVKAKVEAYYNYYLYGMLQPQRNFNAGDSRVAFNGKMKDDELYGSGNFYDYGFRMYDSRIVRFATVDPLSAKYPWNSTYSFAEGDPINFIDLDGLEKAPQRNFNTADSRYGFNGKEKDDEIKGSGNSYDYGARIYDPRVARFLSEDPLQSSFPSLSPYQFSGNSPLAMVDLDGLEPAAVNPNTQTLVFILQGYVGEDPPNGQTQVSNNPNDMEDEALGSIYSTGSTLQVVKYSSSSTENTKTDVLSTIKAFKKANPNGKVVIIGHSGGGDNGIELAKENPLITIDLLITLDSQDPKPTGIDDNNIPKNVKNAINYYQTSEGIGGETMDFSDKTNGANILSPGSNHRSIDNDQYKNVVQDINNFVKGKDVVKLANNRKQPVYNPKSSGSDNIGGLPGGVKDIVNPKSIR